MLDSYNNDTRNTSIGWDESIQDDGREYKLLPEGDYPFYVTNFEKSWYDGSDKINPCNKAILTLRVKDSEGGFVYVKTSLLLNTKLEWKLSSFFRSVGMKERGGAVTPDWNKVVGSVGRAHFSPHTYGTDEKKQANGVDYFLDWDEQAMSGIDLQEMADDEFSEPLPL